MILRRDLPDHWIVESEVETWLTDAAIDLTKFEDGTHPVSFEAWADIPADATLIVSLKTGGSAEEVGNTLIAVSTQHGPYYGPIIGENVAGLARQSGMILLHLTASTSNALLPIDVLNVRTTIGTDA